MSSFGILSLLQYVSGDSYLHRLDPRSKYGFAASYSICVVASHSVTVILFDALVALLLCLLSKLRLYALWENIRGFMVFVIFLAFNQMVLNGTEAAALMALKMFSFILIVALLLSTTPPEKQMEGLRKWLSPLRRLGVKTESWVMMFTIAVIYIPLLMEDFTRIMQAQRVRGPQYSRWNVAGRGKEMLLLLTPLLLTTFRRADRLADAMESRCFCPGSDRTAFYLLKFGMHDTIVFILAMLFPIIHWSFG